MVHIKAQGWILHMDLKQRITKCLSFLFHPHPLLHLFTFSMLLVQSILVVQLILEAQIHF